MKKSNYQKPVIVINGFKNTDIIANSLLYHESEGDGLQFDWN